MNDKTFFSFPPPLKKEEEKKCFEQIKEGNKEGRDKLIIHNLRLVPFTIQKYCPSESGKEDVVSVGIIGLIKAVDTFNLGKKYEFATYATICIRNEILKNCVSENKKNAMEVSFENEISKDENQKAIAYSDILFVEDDVLEEIFIKTESKKAAHFIQNCLSEKERISIVMTFGLSGYDKTQTKEIANYLGISKQRVNVIRNTALNKIKEYLIRQPSHN